MGELLRKTLAGPPYQAILMDTVVYYFFDQRVSSTIGTVGTEYCQ